MKIEWDMIAIISALSIFEILAFYTLKKFSQTGNILYYFCGLLAYGLAATVLALSFRYEKMGIINLSWNILSTVYVFLIGYLLFSEKLSKVEIGGVIVSMIGFLMMTVKL